MGDGADRGDAASARRRARAEAAPGVRSRSASPSPARRSPRACSRAWSFSAETSRSRGFARQVPSGGTRARSYRRRSVPRSTPATARPSRRRRRSPPLRRRARPLPAAPAGSAARPARGSSQGATTRRVAAARAAPGRARRATRRRAARRVAAPVVGRLDDPCRRVARPGERRRELGVHGLGAGRRREPESVLARAVQRVLEPPQEVELLLVLEPVGLRRERLELRERLREPAPERAHLCRISLSGAGLGRHGSILVIRPPGGHTGGWSIDEIVEAII